ncbi:hypothetical protein ABEF95_013762 [Exophiala dermatitidis]
MNAPEFLSSHSSAHFAAAKSYSRSDMSSQRQAASRLVYISDWKLNKESARDEPRLRRLLGHLSVNEQTTEFVQQLQTPAPAMSVFSVQQQQQQQQQQQESNELSAYLQYVPVPVPSFREFQAAIEIQIATMVQITAASAARLNFVGENNNNNNGDTEDDTSSDHDSYDSYDDEDTTDTSSAAGSDDSSDNSSFTTDDNDDSMASSESDCGRVSGSDSPFRLSCSCSRKGELSVCGEQDDEDDETESPWALRPLALAPLIHAHHPQAITIRC